MLSIKTYSFSEKQIDKLKLMETKLDLSSSS